MVKAMVFIARQLNDEGAIVRWVENGVADGDIDYGDLAAEDDGSLEFYIKDENFADLMETFLWCMKMASISGGLYCDGLVSRPPY